MVSGRPSATCLAKQRDVESKSRCFTLTLPTTLLRSCNLHEFCTPGTTSRSNRLVSLMHSHRGFGGYFIHVTNSMGNLFTSFSVSYPFIKQVPEDRPTTVFVLNLSPDRLVP